VHASPNHLVIALASLAQSFVQKASTPKPCDKN